MSLTRKIAHAPTMDLVGGVKRNNLVKVTHKLGKGCAQALQSDNPIN